MYPRIIEKLFRLAQQGCTVVGVEAVEKAILEFFEDNNIGHTVHSLDGGVKAYKVWKKR